MPFSRPGWSWDVIWMKMGRKCRELDWGATTWMETRWRWDGGVSRGETHVSIWIWVRWEDLRFIWGETCPGLWWDTNIGYWLGVIWVKVRREYLYLDGMVHGWGLYRCGPRYGSWWEKSFWTWMEVRQESWDMDGSKTPSGWRWDSNYRELDWGEIRPGGMWDVILGDLDGFETWPGWI